MKRLFFVVMCIMLLVTAFCYAQEENKTDISVLLVCDSTRGTLPKLDSTFKSHMASAGYILNERALDYRDVTTDNVKEFNVVVMMYPSTEGNTEARKYFDAATPIIYDFIQQGGGVFIFADEAYDSYITLNDFLNPLGAKVLPESVIDQNTLFRQDRYFLEYFCSTANFAQHPITKNVQKLIYPLASSPETARGTLTMTVDDEWDVVIKGNATAYSYSSQAHHIGEKTYTSKPPLMAVREYGKGRIILFPTRCLNYIHQGNHMVYEGICMKNGEGQTLMENSISWLALPSITSPILGGYAEPQLPEIVPPEPVDFSKIEDVYPYIIRAGSRPFITEIKHESVKRNDYVGILGVYTTYSKGYGTVEQFCDKAKELGYNYLVFTDDFQSMDEQKWSKLVADCKENSTNTFVAIPGIEIKDNLDQTTICFDMPRWINKDWLDESGQVLVSHPGLYFGMSYSFNKFLPKYFLEPKANFMQPWFSKFYAGIEVFSYARGNRILDDCLDWYLQCQANDYNLIPISTHRIFTPQDLNNIMGFKTHVLTKDISSVPGEFGYGWYSPRNVYLSEGPEIVEFTIENGRGAYREEPWKLYIELTSQNPLKSVTVLDRKRVFRKYYPNSRQFNTIITGYHDKQRFFTLLAEDIEGNKMVSSSLYTSDIRQATYMCTDLQNTLNAGVNVNRSGKTTHYSSMGGVVTGWDSVSPGLLVDPSEIIPASGIEYGFRGWNAATTPVVLAQSIREQGVAQRDMVFDSGDCNILDNYYYCKLLPFKGGLSSPMELINGNVRYIGFTPRPYSLNPLIVEHTTTFLRDCTLQDVEGPELISLAVGASQSGFPRYCIVNADGKKITGVRDDEKKQYGIIEKGEYMALYPNFWGAFALFPLSDTYDYVLDKSQLKAGFDLPNKEFKKGDSLTTRYIIIKGTFGQGDETEFDRFRNAYGFDGSTAYTATVNKGTLVDSVFTVKLTADNYQSEGTITRANLPQDLGVTVDGLCDNWDAGMLDVRMNTLQRVGVFGDRAYVTLNINNRNRSFIIGNLIVCDKEDIQASLLKKGDGFVVEVHNPLGREITVAVEIPAWLGDIVGTFKKDVTLKAGGTQSFDVEK